MKLENQNILIISNEPWGPFWYSKHNYANELSKKNRVFFLDPPHPFKPGNIFNKKIREKKVSQNLTVLEYDNIYPVSLLHFWKWNDKAILKLLKNYFSEKGVDDILFWTFDPIRLGFPELLKPKKTILHIVDNYLFHFRTETLLAVKADAVICVSQKIAVNYHNLNKNLHVIRHAIPDDEFLPAMEKREGRITGLFIGKIDLRIDIDFNLAIFRSFPQVDFKIIGSVSPDLLEKMNASGLKNIILLPPISSTELKHQVRAADFCFIFKKIYKGNNIFSHKLLQYLAQGKPVFGTDFSDVNEELKNAFYLSNDVNKMSSMLTNYLKEGEDKYKTDLRINYAKQNTFSKALSEIETFLN